MSSTTFFASGADDSLPQRTVLNTQFGQYEWAKFDGVNRSGMKPLCDKALVLCDQPVEMTAGGIIIADTIRETTGFAAMTGFLVAAGPQAFAYDSRRLVHWEGERPSIGDRVYFRKYSGDEYWGKDGLMYRVMEDRAIACVEIAVPDGEASASVAAARSPDVVFVCPRGECRTTECPAYYSGRTEDCPWPRP